MEEQNFCGYIADEHTRNRALANLIGIKVALEFFKKNGLPVTVANAAYKIKGLFEELDVADIYIDNVRLDVRLSLSKTEFTIPKKHYEYNVTPDLYMFVTYDESTAEAKVAGFISPNNVSHSKSDGYYYIISSEDITSAENTAELFDNLSAKAKDVLPLNAKKKAILFLDNQVVDKKEFYQEVINCEKFRQLLIDYQKTETILQKTSFTFTSKPNSEFPIKTVLSTEASESPELELKPVESEVLEDISLGFADGLVEEPAEEILLSKEDAELNSFINNEPVAETPLPSEKEADDNTIVESIAAEAEVEAPIIELDNTIEELPEIEGSLDEVSIEDNINLGSDDNIIDFEGVPGNEPIIDSSEAEINHTAEELNEPDSVLELVEDVDDDLVESENSAEELPLIEDVEDNEQMDSEQTETMDLTNIEVEEVLGVEELNSIDLEENIELVEEELIENSIEFTETLDVEEVTAQSLELDDEPIKILAEEEPTIIVAEEESFSVADETLDDEEISDITLEDVEELSLDVEPIELEPVEDLTFSEFADGIENNDSTNEEENNEIEEESGLSTNDDPTEDDEDESPTDFDKYDNLDENYIPDFALGEFKLEGQEEALEEIPEIPSVNIVKPVEEAPELLDEDESLELSLESEGLEIAQTNEAEIKDRELGIDLQATMEGFVNTLEPETSIIHEEKEVNPDAELEAISEDAPEQDNVQEVSTDENIAQSEVLEETKEQSKEEEKEDFSTTVVSDEISELYNNDDAEISEVAASASYKKKTNANNLGAVVLLVLVAAAGALGYMYKDMILEKFFSGSSNTESVPSELAKPEQPTPVVKKVVKKKAAPTKTEEILEGIEEPVQLLDTSVSVANLSIEFDVPSSFVNSYSRRYLIKLAKRAQLRLRNELLLSGEQPMANKIVVDLSVDKDVVKFEKISSSSGSNDVDKITTSVVESTLKDTAPYAGTFGENKGTIRLLVKF